MARTPTKFYPALLIATACCLAAATTTALSAADAKIGFVAVQEGTSLEGNFGKFSTDAQFDPTHPEGAKIRVTIDLGSVQAGDDDSTRLLKGREFFDVAAFPSATFEATSIVATGAGTYEARGPLTLKGRTAPLAVPFTASRAEGAIRIEGKARVSRLAYQVGTGQWSNGSTLDDDVQILFHLQIPG